MFVQVIQGKVSNPAGLRAAVERWMEKLSPGATGWLGSTGGVTEDGRAIALVRFESEEDARRNSDRPEQGEWYAEFATLFSEEPSFSESDQVDVDTNGDPDEARFVQVMQGASTDPERARAMMNEDSSAWAAFRPEVIGSLAVQHDGGRYTMALYFTSEADAREGEKKEPPAELRAKMEEMDALSTGAPEFFDLKDPWLHSPG